MLFTRGTEATTEQSTHKLGRTFGNVACGQTVHQQFYAARQRENERVTLWLLGLNMGYTARQIIGIPMGTNCAPYVADLFLFCDEKYSMMFLSRVNQADII